MLNQDVHIGHLALDLNACELELRHTLALRGAGGATPEQIEDVVDFMLGECEQAYPAIYQVVHGKMAAAEAAAAVDAHRGRRRTMLITLIGCGKMGSAMLQGWLNDPGLDADFAIVEPHHDALAWTTSHQCQAFADCAAAAAATCRPSQMVVLAVKPQIMDEAIVSLAGIADSDSGLSVDCRRHPDHLVCCASAKRGDGSDALVLRSMPNTPAAIGRGVGALFR